MKILFSHVEIHNEKVTFTLSRQEVVSLINAFARFVLDFMSVLIINKFYLKNILTIKFDTLFFFMCALKIMQCFVYFICQ